MKGKTNNPNGRPKNSINPLMASIREEIRKGVATNGVVNTMFIRLSEIKDAYKYVQTALNIFDIILPRLASESPDIDSPQSTVNSTIDKIHSILQESIKGEIELKITKSEQPRKLN